MEEIQKISENKLISAATGEEVPVKSLWENQTCVITFFRRFGCGFCRLAANELSSIKPQLDAHNVRLVGVGVEKEGVEEFMQGKFFDGDLFIDDDKKCYKDLQYKRYNMMSIMIGMVEKSARDAISKVRAKNLSYDMKGDKYQVGGTIIVNKGGTEILLNHKQQTLADHATPAEILKALGIESN